MLFLAVLMLIGFVSIIICLTNSINQKIIQGRKNNIEEKIIEDNIKEKSDNNYEDPIEKISNNMYTIKSCEHSNIKSTIQLEIKDSISELVCTCLSSLFRLRICF